MATRKPSESEGPAPAGGSAPAPAGPPVDVRPSERELAEQAQEGRPRKSERELAEEAAAAAEQQQADAEAKEP